MTCEVFEMAKFEKGFAVLFANGSEFFNLSDSDLGSVQLFKDYPDGLLRFTAACFFIFMVIGISGNLITIIALARYEKVRNATAIFIMNLSCSDLLFCCFNLPLANSTFLNRSWKHGIIFCKLYPIMRYGLVAASLFTVLAITINRYVMIAHPRLYPKMYKTRNIGIMLVVIWMAAFSLLTPTALNKWGRFGLDVKIGSCSIIDDKNGQSPKKILFLSAFILPCVAIIICYTRIFFIVRKTSRKSKSVPYKGGQPSCVESSSIDSSDSMSVRVSGPEVSSSDNLENNSEQSENMATQKAATFQIQCRDETKRSENRLHRTALRKSMAMLKLSLPTRKDRRLGTMIMAIMVTFCVCHLPITITKMLRDINPVPASTLASYILLYLSSCMNPVIYVVMSNEYRKAYKNLFRCRRRS
ncbi:G-protein coupled receptor moody-like [Zerene cesonia]|uniref:G-protein coupled receptor moody-like n=1 Tax=Zerene cesonia TaxID=33412 RepID=UPI0018E58E15|nr:G-protein coupled receptor moody-like [Zerene cesonia]